jgi:hypothetical protein
MRRTGILLIGATVISLAGCVLNGKKSTASAVTPPAPPAVSSSAPPPRRSLSTPQTQVQLPPAQPVNPEALAAAPQPEDQVEAPANPRPPRRVGPSAIPAPPRNTEAAQTAPQPAAAPAAAPPVEETRPPIGEIVPPSETRKLQDSADAHKREIKQLLDQARAKGLTKRQQTVVEHIESFVKMSDQAQGKGDMRNADALAERALVLAKDLQGAR